MDPQDNEQILNGETNDVKSTDPHDPEDDNKPQSHTGDGASPG